MCKYAFRWARGTTCRRAPCWSIVPSPAHPIKASIPHARRPHSTRTRKLFWPMISALSIYKWTQKHAFILLLQSYILRLYRSGLHDCMQGWWSFGATNDDGGWDDRTTQKCARAWNPSEQQLLLATSSGQSVMHGMLSSGHYTLFDLLPERAPLVVWSAMPRRRRQGVVYQRPAQHVLHSTAWTDLSFTHPKLLARIHQYNGLGRFGKIASTRSSSKNSSIYCWTG
jgi:hypothetical protein